MPGFKDPDWHHGDLDWVDAEFCDKCEAELTTEEDEEGRLMPWCNVCDGGEEVG